MFPEIARDDIFRLETRRLWLRWPRASDAPAIERYSRLYEVARHTARIPHPYPAGSAERFVFAAREANAAGRALTLVVTTARDPREAIGAVSVEARGEDRLTLGYVLSPEAWNKGFATEAVEAIVEASFTLTRAVEINAAVHLDNPASGRVLEKAGFAHVGEGLEGAPARGGMVESHRFQLSRAAWSASRERAHPLPPRDGATIERAHEIP